MVDFVSKIKILRKRENMIQAILAKRLGVTKATVSSYETGARFPSSDILIAMTGIFNVSSDYLLGIEKNYDVDLSGLTEEEIYAVKRIIRAIKDKYKKKKFVINI